MYKHISFVRPQQEYAELCDIKPEPPPPTTNGLSGEEAQSFYEELLGIPSSSYPASTISSASHPASKQTSPAIDSSDDEVEGRPTKARNRRASAKDLLSAAQNGHCKELRRILHARSLDVNLQDAFGWSALHCAAFEGHLSCVRLLLKFGAARELRDNKGRTALELARRRKKIRVYRAIKEFGTNCPDNAGELGGVSVEAEPDVTRCTLCGVDFDVDKQDAHEISIVHRSAQSAATDPIYGISEINKGFQMLRHMGWEREQGLGVDGQGRKFPVKTQLKRDREGLGLTTKPSKVTHFDPEDPHAIQNENPTQAITNRSSKRKSADKNLERDFRRAFY
ncbi:G patch domain and ankyrin repeat-containing protein 1-like [Tropilaelaps mercedesae]|uniref:G patch domain and ankyrin repeat-containing protein 1-like n=1 Tax=Tropilaelaps mercedesae TaxID=418985 RepID=A0A1V9XES3_9ACAR|nr:G patch domain and ankyrin repeat-containing protein 1-like [Tropilaelaps mercedesae]